MGIIGSVNDWLIVMQNRVYSILLYEGLIETLYTVLQSPCSLSKASAAENANALEKTHTRNDVI
jgi:hypothetical protein